MAEAKSSAHAFSVDVRGLTLSDEQQRSSPQRFNPPRWRNWRKSTRAEIRLPSPFRAFRLEGPRASGSFLATCSRKSSRRSGTRSLGSACLNRRVPSWTGGTGCYARARTARWEPVRAGRGGRVVRESHTGRSAAAVQHSAALPLVRRAGGRSTPSLPGSRPKPRCARVERRAG